MKAFTLSVVLIYFFSSSLATKSLDDILSPCSFKESDCIVGLWQRSVKYLASGSEELSVPPLDPLKVENVDVDVPGLVYMQFDGYMRGMKGCVFDSAHTNMKKGNFKVALDLHCNVTLKGHYNVTINNTVLFGSENDGHLKADGIAKLKLDNLQFKFLMDFSLKRNKEGVVKFVMKEGPVQYKYTIGGPVIFDINKVYLGNNDITKPLVTFLNQNWKFVMDTFGDFFFRRAMEIVSEFPRAVINAMPASSYFTEDMDQYLVD